jgi:hypothetical protein
MNAITIDPFNDGRTVTRFGDKSGAPLLFEYGGRFFATNLFKLHDTHGFPLANSVDECRRRGWVPCLDQFIADAIRAGWPRERAQRTVDEAKADAA